MSLIICNPGGFMGYKFFIFVIIVSFALHGMEKENTPSKFSQFKSKIKSIGSKILSSTNIKIAKHPDLQLDKILQQKRKEISVLKAGQEIKVTNQATKILKGLSIVFYTSEKKSIFPNTQNRTIEETGIYTVRNDSSVTTKYPIIEMETSYGHGIYLPVLSYKVAQHIELYKILKEVKHESIFKPYCQAITAGYNLDIIYEDIPEVIAWAFDLTINNSPMIFDNPGFLAHAKRIENISNIINLKAKPLDNLLILKRH